MVENKRVELLTSPCKGDVIPFHQFPTEQWSSDSDSNRGLAPYKGAALAN